MRAVQIEREYWPTITIPLLIGVAGFLLCAATMWHVANQVGSVTLLLAKATLMLVPMIVWFGMVSVVVLWFLAMAWVWRS